MKNFFFCGIGGIGMSGLARFLYSQGNSVSGSDQANSELIADLQHEGIQVFLEQTADNIAEHCQEFIYSEAIPQHHPERREAARRGIPQKSYFQKLGEVSQDFFTICIAGTHGKSSTTVMAGLALEHAGVDPTVIVGTKVFEWQKKNFRFGNSNFLVVESCEYRESFLHLCPNIIVFTSLEPEHLDYYKTSENYFYAFEKFIHRLPPDGVLIVDESDVNIQTVMSAYTGKTVHSHQFLNNVPQ